MSSNAAIVDTNNELMLKSISSVLNQVTKNFVNYLPLIFTIFGFIGFIGNLFTYLQSELRSNTCCIYSLCGSIVDVINLFLNLFPNYLVYNYGVRMPWTSSSSLCKLYVFLLQYFPHLSTNFLLMAIIDRFASTCSLGSPLRRLNRLKMVPLMISITIITSFLATLYVPLLFDLYSHVVCLSTHSTTSNILYIILFGLTQPIAMLIFILLTYENVRKSRRRVAGTTGLNTRQARNQFILMIFAQVLINAFFSLQWIIAYMYITFTTSTPRTADQTSIVYFVFSLSNYCYYLNNVKSFYVSILTSGLFRRTFIKSFKTLLPRQMHRRFQISEANGSIAAVTRIRRADTVRN